MTTRVLSQIKAQLRRRVDTTAERGAVLALVGMSLVILLASGAMAVDLSSLERQGQELQNAADAAALAGVATWSETLDYDTTEAVVADVVAQNGIELGGDISMVVNYPSPLQVEVELIDGAPDVFLAGAIGMGGELARDATAELNICEESCSRAIDLPEPLTALRADGDGDGFLPVVVGDKIYAINHGNNKIHCVDRNTNEECWSSRTLFPSFPDSTTMYVAHTYVHGTRIFYLIWEGETTQYNADKEPQTFLNLTCWETLTDTPCPMTAEIRNAGQGILAGTEDGLYVFAGNLHTHCFEPENLEERCPKYGGGGRVEELRKEGRKFHQYWSNRLTAGDHVTMNDRIYFTAAREDGMVWLACWDIRKECRGFEAPPVNDSGTTAYRYDDLLSGRLFLYRDADGEPQAVCSIGSRVRVHCLDPDTGERVPSAEAAMSVTTERMQVDGPLIGVMTYHPWTNRLFLVSDVDHSTTYCHDFTTGRFCGELRNSTPWGDAQTYGYYPEPDCLIGLGHAQVFFTLRPDMTGECDGSSLEIDIDPCRCGGEVVWPPLRAFNLEGVGSFEIQIQDPDGNVVLPEDGEGWIDLGPEPLDLSGISTSHEKLKVVVNVEPDDNADPWADGEAPRLLIGVGDLDPRLVE